MLALTFEVGSDRVAWDVRRVREVVPRVRLNPLSGGPSWVAGMFVYRGRVIPVIDLHRFIGAGECPPHLSSRIILLPFPSAGPDALIGLLAHPRRRCPRAERIHVGDRPDGFNIRPAVADSSGILHILDPDRFLAQHGLTSAILSEGVLDRARSTGRRSDRSGCRLARGVRLSHKRSRSGCRPAG